MPFLTSCLVPLVASSVTSAATEDIQVPKSLMFLRDTPVAVAATMAIFFMLASIIAGGEFVETVSSGQNWVVFHPFMQSLIFLVVFTSYCKV